MDFDFTSLITGAGFVAVAGWIGSFLALRKDERGVQIKQITEERTKWRAQIRAITQNIVKVYADNKEPSNETIASNRAALVTSLNPKCKYDEEILVEYDKLKHNGDLKCFTHAIALLLKHDWERVKWETTPIYQKPFFYMFHSKALEWKNDDYRKLDRKG